MLIQQPQTSPPQTAIPVVHRQLKQGQVHQFRIHVTTGSEFAPAETYYTFLSKTEMPKEQGKSPDVDFKILNYSTSAEGMKYRAKLTGAGKLNLGETGLPELLLQNVKSSTIWYPLLCFFLPAEVKDGKFEVQEDVAKGIDLHGTGTVDGASYTIDGAIESGGQQLGTVKVKWSLDKYGWPRSAEGSVEDSNGKTSFTVSSH